MHIHNVTTNSLKPIKDLTLTRNKPINKVNAEHIMTLLICAHVHTYRCKVKLSVYTPRNRVNPIKLLCKTDQI